MYEQWFKDALLCSDSLIMAVSNGDVTWMSLKSQIWQEKYEKSVEIYEVTHNFW